jgi:hypothetical protein
MVTWYWKRRESLIQSKFTACRSWRYLWYSKSNVQALVTNKRYQFFRLSAFVQIQCNPSNPWNSCGCEWMLIKKKHRNETTPMFSMLQRSSWDQKKLKKRGIHDVAPSGITECEIHVRNPRMFLWYVTRSKFPLDSPLSIVTYPIAYVPADVFSNQFAEWVLGHEICRSLKSAELQWIRKCDGQWTQKLDFSPHMQRAQPTGKFRFGVGWITTF